jgi:lipoprotein signal peptidase
MATKQLASFHFLIISVLVVFNLSVSAFVRYNSLFYIPNENPLGFQFGLYYSVLIIGFICWALIYFKIFLKHPIISILILAGAMSNFLEKWVFYNSVADYISIGFSHFNLADVQIWIGLILLNLHVWIFDNKQYPTPEQAVRNEA